VPDWYPRKPRTSACSIGFQVFHLHTNARIAAPIKVCGDCLAGRKRDASFKSMPETDRCPAEAVRDSCARPQVAAAAKGLLTGQGGVERERKFSFFLMFTPRTSLLALVSAAISVAAAAPAALAADLTFSTKTWGANGLGNLGIRKVFVDGNNVYAATQPVYISNDGGASFTPRSNGLVHQNVLGVYASGSNVYVGTEQEVGISTDGGVSFSSKTTANGLASNGASDVYAIGNTVYAASGNAVGISTDGGASFTNYNNGLNGPYVVSVYASGSNVYAGTWGNEAVGGLGISTDGGNNYVNDVYAIGNTIYAATGVYSGDGTGGLSISTDGGTSWFNYTTANGLGDNSVYGVYVSGNSIYAATWGGLSVSNDAGSSWYNYTTADGLADNRVVSVHANGSTVYAATLNGLSFAQLPTSGLSAVPGPLPLFGIASAFSFSRRLRRRLRGSTSAATITSSQP
jgi:hypothetical protein